MQLSLAGNISKLRKAHAMTQEQLAEALGVTFAAVSKWERGVATPELSLIAELADLFEVSLDALIGYEFKNHDKAHVIDWLKRCFHSRDYEDIFPEIEKALQRYPNCFDIVYYSARIYYIRGLYQKNPAYSRRALPLYRHACQLIGENTDPDISETSIAIEMAELYLSLDDPEKALELLKQHNPCQLNHPQIGYTLASVCNDPQAALPYLSLSLLDLSVTLQVVAMGYLNIFYKTGDYANALDVVNWALAFYPPLRSPEKRSYLDKCETTFWALRAAILLALHRQEDAADSLRHAKSLALYFDEAPSYDAQNVRFVSCKKPATAFDSMGDTAMLSLDNVVGQFDTPELHDLWEVVKHEG